MEKKVFNNYNVNAPFLTFKKFKMFGMAKDNNKSSILTWGCRDGNPRITINTNVEADKKNTFGMINAGFNPETFFTILDLLEEVANSTESLSYKIDNKTTVATDDGKRSDPFIASELWIGKDPDGIVWISVIAPDRPKIKFNFTISNYHLFHKKGEGALTPEKASKLQALSVVRILRNAYIPLVSEFTTSGSKRDKSADVYVSNAEPTVTKTTELSFDDIEM